MNTLKFLTSLVFVSIFFVSCSNDDDSPEIVNEEEVITTMTVTLTPDDGGTSVILQTLDLDGDGGNDPVVTVTGNLSTATTYNGSIVLLNQTEDPAEDITEEVEEEDLDHQFFYTVGSGLNVTVDNANLDSEGNILGTTFDLTTGAASTGALTFTLRHEPTKQEGSNDADAAGGETDIEATFSLEVE
tara:strand:- start:33 stop:593 length:561 start_codon:yes stop_codon:yes gene_type:complete